MAIHTAADSSRAPARIAKDSDAQQLAVYRGSSSVMKSWSERYREPDYRKLVVPTIYPIYTDEARSLPRAIAIRRLR